MVSEEIRNDSPVAGRRLLPLLLAGLLMSAPVGAQVYKCTDAAGKVQYTDSPCGESSTAIRRCPSRFLRQTTRSRTDQRSGAPADGSASSITKTVAATHSGPSIGP